MRLAGQAKLGYYPTPASQLALIGTWLASEATINRSDPARILDPCAGQGEALAYLAEALGGRVSTYGIELSPQRAQAAAQVLDHTLNTGFENAVLTDETFSLVFLNPPYDGETHTGGGERQEFTFLQPSTRLLARGGVLVYIIPETRLSEVGRGASAIARHLAGWYEALRCYRFTADEYAVFKQIVIFGRKRLAYKQPTQAEVAAVTCWAQGRQFPAEEGQTGLPDGAQPDESEKALSSLPQGDGSYHIPPSPRRGPKGAAFSFRFTPVSLEDFLQAAAGTAQALNQSAAWLDLIPQTEPPSVIPAITPKLGHVAMQVSGGLLGTNQVTAPDGQALLIKGGTEKFTVRVDEDEIIEATELDDPEKRKKLFRVKVEERSRPVLTTLDGAGKLVALHQPDAIRDVLRQHISRLARQLEARNVPRYDRQPEPYEWALLETLSKGRHLPGRHETGLTAPQKHFTIALGRLLLAQGAGMINGEMGIGKSTIALAVAEYLRGIHRRRVSRRRVYPALIVGPGIVTGEANWPREVREVIPGAEGRVIEITARPLPKPARIKDWLKSQGLQVDENPFTGLPAQAAWRELEASAFGQKIEVNNVTRLALQSSLRRAELDLPAPRKGALAPNLLDGRIGGYLWLGLIEAGSDDAIRRAPDHRRELERRYSLVQFLREYARGALPEKAYAILSYETAKLGAGRVPAMPTRRVRMRVRVEDRLEKRVVRVCVCPECGRLVSDEYDEEGRPLLGAAIRPGKSAEQFVGARRRFCQAPQPRYRWNPESGRRELHSHAPDGRLYVCAAPLFAYTGLRREAAARYLQRKARKAFPLLIVDELHEAKAKGTGNGWALTVLANLARYTLGLTGTLFGGYATDIFWLMYRLSGQVRGEFGFHDERRWVEKVGLRRFTFYATRPEEVQEDGSYTGRQYHNRVDEKPGLLPAIIRYGLPNIVFASLPDMDLPLPAYQEEMAWLELTPEMAEQYDLADGSGFDNPLPGSLYEWAVNEMKAGTPGALSVWLHAALSRPNSMFRDETVTFNRRIAGKGKYALRREETVLELPEVEPVSPKDLWLAERCLAERRQGRKVLVFIRQTGKHDIQPHILEVLEAHGLRVGVLTPGIAPRRRVAWIKRHSAKVDVLLTNARLVKVGLNLRMFATAIFFEIEWSLAILWQAMRRVYRPGAPLPVRVIFPAYAGTLEERALGLIGQKMKAASLFYGDEVASALTEEDESDFLNDLVRSVLKNETVARAEAIFAQENDLSASPLGSPTVLSPQAAPVVTLAEWLARRGVGRMERRGRQKSVPDGQLFLPF